MIDIGASRLNDEFTEEAHEFEVDLNCVVVVNHKLTLESIDRSEDEELSRVQEIFASFGHEVLSSEISHIGIFHEDLRRAANNLAVVGLVTRLQHWIIKFVKLSESKKLPKPKKPKRKKPGLVSNLALLNGQLGKGPVSVRFFWRLVNVRDSVIHGDSRAEWEFPRNKLRGVAKRYLNSWGYVELDPGQLKEAIANAVQQVKWYHEKLLSLGEISDESRC